MWRVVRAPWNRRIGLGVLVLGAALTYYVLSVLRYEQFYGGNWDLGINMQMLWSTTHGHLLYEAGDFESNGSNSFLLIHTAYIAIPIAYLYALAPGAEALFALQAVVVASSAVPLYLIGRRADVKESVLWGALIVYLLSFPILSSLLFDFHWESFLPAEFLWLYYLWETRRFRWAIVPAVLGVLTIEVFPFLLLGYVLYGAYPWLARLARRPAAALRELRTSWPATRRWVALAVFALLAYVALRVSQHDVVPVFVGGSSGGYSTQVNNALGVFDAFTASWSTIGGSLEYWVLLLAGFGLVPLLYRQRLLLVNLPWFVASVVAYVNFTIGFGNQYAFVALAPLAIGFVEGLAGIGHRRLEGDRPGVTPLEWLILAAPLGILAALDSAVLLSFSNDAAVWVIVLLVLTLAGYLAFRWIRARWRHRPSTPSPSTPRRPHARAQRWGLLGTIALLLVVNLLLSPLNTANFEASGQPAYDFAWQSNAAFADMPAITALIPDGATVVASNNLFPFVANDVHAYSLSWWPAPLPYLPFNASHLPPYALLSSGQLGVAPTYLRDNVFNASVYGARGMIYYNNYPGSIYLFQLGYTGPPAIWEASPFSNTTYLCPPEFILGASGRGEDIGGTQCGSELYSVPSTDLSGNGASIWYGPYTTLLKGNYTVTLSLRGQLNPGLPPSLPVVYVNANAFGLSSYWYSTGISAAELSPTQWTEFQFHFALSQAVSGAEFRGYLALTKGPQGLTANGQVELNYIEVQRS